MSTFEPIKRSGLAEEISTRLISLIKEKLLQPGDKQPPERELAAMLNVSRPSLREALRALAILNIIEIRQGDGTYVSSLDTELLVEHLDLIFSLDDSTILQLFEVRKIFEPEIAALAAARITADQIQAMEANRRAGFLLGATEAGEILRYDTDGRLIGRMDGFGYVLELALE